MNEQIKDPYYSRPEVSNSDLSWLKKYWQPDEYTYDLEKTYAFGTLIDCMITEPHKVNYFTRRCAGYQHTQEEMDLAEEMKKSFYRNPTCAHIARLSQYQRISIKPEQRINHDGFTFTLPMRCKWDLFIPNLDMSADIKSTTAETQKQFEEACVHFDYDRQSAVYMNLEDRSNHFLIGISKKNQQVFLKPVKRGDKFFNHGSEKFTELAFQWWSLFGSERPDTSKPATEFITQ